MERYDEIMNAVCKTDEEKVIFGKLVGQFVYLEQRMDELMKLPQLKVHPGDPSLQKPTPAHKQYKELLQQYTNISKVLGRLTGGEDQDDDSPLRAWAKNRLGANAD